MPNPPRPAVDSGGAQQHPAEDDRAHSANANPKRMNQFMEFPQT